MNRRFSDKLRGMGGMAIIFIAASHICFGHTNDQTDAVFAAIGALIFLAIKDE
jgi:hypothetical protein